MADTAKISDLTARNTAVTEDELFEISEYQGTPGEYLSKKVKRSYILGYKSYIATLTQSGTNAPTANLLENSIGGTPVWSRDSAGNYRLTLTGLFTANKVVILMSQENDVKNNAIRLSDNVVQITSSDTTGGSEVPSDGLLSNTTIEIRVYY